MRVLRKIRQTRGITQRLLCLRAGISGPTLWAYETKPLKAPRPSTLIKIGRALDVDPSVLLCNVEDLKPHERQELGLG